MGDIKLFAWSGFTKHEQRDAEFQALEEAALRA